MEDLNDFRNKWLLILFFLLILSTVMFFAFSLSLKNKNEKLKPIEPANITQPKYIVEGRDGTYIDKKTYYFSDTLSNYCFEYIPEDSIIVLRCVCLCDEYKDKK